MPQATLVRGSTDSGEAETRNAWQPSLLLVGDTAKR